MNLKDWSGLLWLALRWSQGGCLPRGWVPRRHEHLRLVRGAPAVAMNSVGVAIRACGDPFKLERRPLIPKAWQEIEPERAEPCRQTPAMAADRRAA